MISIENKAKNIAFIVMLLLAFLGIQSVLAATTIDYYSYPLTISSSTFTPTTAYAGNEINIVLNLYNKSKAKVIENAVIKLSAPESFQVINESEIKIDSLQQEETTTIVFKVKAKENAVQGTHVFTVFISYDVASENIKRNVKDTATVAVTLQGVYALNMEIKASNLRPHILEEFTVKALIENNSASEVKNVKAELSIDGSTSFTGFIIVDGTQRRIASIKGNSKEEIVFTLVPSKNISVGTYTFKLDLSCENCSVTSTEKIAVEVLGKPNLIVSGIDYSIEGRDTKNLMQGDLFSISVQLDNIGEEKAKSVKVMLDIDEGIIGTKESFIGNIDPDDSGSAVFDLKVAENANEGYHEGTIKIEYLDEQDKKQIFTASYKFFIEKKPPESPIALLVLILAILIVLYFIVKMVLRQLAIKKLE